MVAQPSPLRDGVIFSKDQNHEISKRELRRQKLSPFKISAFSTFRILDYCDEAENSFINGCFRSCIICSAIAVELALKHTLIFQSEEWEETYWEIEVRKLQFSRVVKRLRMENIRRDDLYKDADWLRRARNEVAAHPLYIGNQFEMREPGYLEPKEPEQQMWACRTMLRDIGKLLRFIEPEKRREIEEKKITKKDNQSRILEEFTVKDFLKLQKPVRYEVTDFLYWRVIQSELIEEIAFLAYKKMVETLNALFP